MSQLRNLDKINDEKIIGIRLAGGRKYDIITHGGRISLDDKKPIVLSDEPLRIERITPSYKKSWEKMKGESEFVYGLKQMVRMLSWGLYPLAITNVVFSSIQMHWGAGILGFPFLLSIYFVLIFEGAFRTEFFIKEDVSKCFYYNIIPLTFIFCTPILLDYFGNPNFTIFSPIFVILPLTLYIFLHIQNFSLKNRNYL